MSYDFDGEYEAILQILPTTATFTDIAAARSFQAANGERVAAALNTAGLTISSHEIPGLPGEPPVTVHVYRSSNVTPNAPCVLRIHGGGFCVCSGIAHLPGTGGLCPFLSAALFPVG